MQFLLNMDNPDGPLRCLPSEDEEAVRADYKRWLADKVIGDPHAIAGGASVARLKELGFVGVYVQGAKEAS